MIEIEATCISCGHDFTPAPDAFRRGTWRTGSRCRDGPGEQAPGMSPSCHTERTNTVNRIARIDVNRLFFSTIPDRRVEEVEAALSQQRANRRTAPSGSIDEDAAARNIVDLELALERAEANLKAHVDLTTRLEATRKAERDEADKAALDAQVDQLRTNYLSQPGTSEADFEKALPRLLERQREDAALNAPALREQQLAEQRRRVGTF